MKKLRIICVLIFAVIAVSKEISAQLEAVSTAVEKASNGFSFRVTPAIQNFVTYYQGSGRIAMETGLANSGLHKSMIRQIFHEQKVPENLAFIQQTLWMSGMETNGGLWLFNDQTAKRFSLKTTKYVDERLDFEKSTRATAIYLKHLAGKYNDNWELVLAAYYSGEQKVDAAIQRAESKDFREVFKYLSKATRDFVPNVLATILIVNNTKEYGFEDVPPAPPIVYEKVSVPASISLELLAKFTDSTPDKIKELNPELLSDTTPPEVYTIRIPLGKADTFTERLKNHLRENKN